MDTPP